MNQRQSVPPRRKPPQKAPPAPTGYLIRDDVDLLDDDEAFAPLPELKKPSAGARRQNKKPAEKKSGGRSQESGGARVPPASPVPPQKKKPEGVGRVEAPAEPRHEKKSGVRSQESGGARVPPASPVPEQRQGRPPKKHDAAPPQGQRRTPPAQGAPRAREGQTAHQQQGRQQPAQPRHARQHEKPPQPPPQPKKPEGVGWVEAPAEPHQGKKSGVRSQQSGGGRVPPAPPVPAPARQEPAHRAHRPAETSRASRQPNGFAPLGVNNVTLAALDAAGYLEPTPVQAGLIPMALKGADVMAQAQTGTGKTAAFAIPLLEKIEAGGSGASPQALVLAPTRELAVQVRDECVKLAEGRPTRIVAVYGGKPLREQIERLRRGVELVVGTPGRVIDLMNRGALTLEHLRFVVLDEADRMLDIGFRPDIERILRRCPRERQTLLLSATIPPPVAKLADRYMHAPQTLDCSSTNVAVETIRQFYFSVDPTRKFDLLVRLLEHEQPEQAIVFCRTKRGTDKLYEQLAHKFPSVGTIHGDLNQSARDRVMRRFRDGTLKLLVATDVVGRGIDVSGISHIINFNIPQFCDDYVHRVGRTGRMGREGVAYTFVSPEEGNELTRIEMRINRLLERAELPGFVALAKPEATEELTDGEDPYAEPEKVPVFGRRSKRYRRAL